MTQLGHGLLPLPEGIFRMTIGNGFLSWYLLLIVIMAATTGVSLKKAKKDGRSIWSDLGFAAPGGKTIDWALCGRGLSAAAAPANARRVAEMLLLSFAAVFLLQLSAPFPYDDYQVPVMTLLAVVVVAFYYRRGTSLWFPVLAAGLMSVSAPQLQAWATYAKDRLWSRKKLCTELAQLRETARIVECLDPGGKDLLTQDLYLAVETGRRVPRGLEMGHFSYFPGLTAQEARARRVLCTADLEALLEEAPCSMAACSGYAFAIAAPVCDEVPFERQKAFWEILRTRYDLVDSIRDFGQNATTLVVLKRKEKGK
jgi:hypothetical protein